MKSWISATCVLFAVGVSGAVSGEESQWRQEFVKTWTEAQAAEQEGRWQDAERLYARVQELVPRESVSNVSRARCLAHLNRNAEALECVREAVEAGWNQADQLRDDPAFEALRDQRAFEQLFKRMEEIRNERILVHVPPQLEVKVPAPLIIAFHGRGENPHYFLPTWEQAADALGAVVVAPRGVHARGNGLLNEWHDSAQSESTSDIDVRGCEAIADQALQIAKEHCKIDGQRIILTGYSQGGAVALALFGRHPERYAGAFAQATLYKPEDDSFWKEARQKCSGRISLIVGELDKLKPHSESAYERLSAAGWEVRMEVVPDVGHEPPPQNTQRQVRAIRFVLEQ